MTELCIAAIAAMPLPNSTNKNIQKQLWGCLQSWLSEEIFTNIPSIHTHTHIYIYIHMPLYLNKPQTIVQVPLTLRASANSHLFICAFTFLFIFIFTFTFIFKHARQQSMHVYICLIYPSLYNAKHIATKQLMVPDGDFHQILPRNLHLAPGSWIWSRFTLKK